MTLFSMVLARTDQEPAQQQRQADHHPEGIGIEEAGLHAAHDAGQRSPPCRRSHSPARHR